MIYYLAINNGDRSVFGQFETERKIKKGDKVVLLHKEKWTTFTIEATYLSEYNYTHLLTYERKGLGRM